MGRVEEWKSVNGYEGIYMVSNNGRVKSLERVVKNSGSYSGYIKIKEKILKERKVGGKRKDKHLYVVLSKDGIEERKLIHRLVAEAFIPNELNLQQVNHKDENPKNNNVENLEWCTSKYNTNYGTTQERRVKTTKENRIKRYNLGEYETKSIRRCNFKKICVVNGLSFSDFDEIQSNEYYIEKRKDGTEYKHKKFFYKRKE